MDNLRMIINSLKKIKEKVVLISIQFLVVLFLVNITINWTIDIVSSKSRIEKIWGKSIISKVSLDLSGTYENAIQIYKKVNELNSVESIFKIQSYDTTLRGFLGNNTFQKLNLKDELITVVIMDKKEFISEKILLDKSNGNQLDNDTNVFIGNSLNKDLSLGTSIKRNLIKNNIEIEENLEIKGKIKKNQVTTNGKNLINLNKSIVIVVDNFFDYIGEESYMDFVRNMAVKLKSEASLSTFQLQLQSLVNQDNYLVDTRSSNLMETIALSSKLNTPTYRLILLMSIVVIFLALIGISGALLSEAMLRKREYGIRLALGARKQDLALLIYGQFFLLFLICNIISYIAIVILADYLNLGDIHISTLVISTLVCIGIAFALSFSSINKILIKNVSELIRGI
ncbi:FtsX-like permease family protein [Clostridium intestinale]|uniref:ABC transporter permease n=1 Tax=Clostridium intestinale TaxID=36845 RepID=UPI0028EDD6D8|nr:FtsX-like permease family protein [Clostridium intestinale]